MKKASKEIQAMKTQDLGAPGVEFSSCQDSLFATGYFVEMSDQVRGGPRDSR